MLTDGFKGASYVPLHPLGHRPTLDEASVNRYWVPFWPEGSNIVLDSHFCTRPSFALPSFPLTDRPHFAADYCRCCPPRFRRRLPVLTRSSSSFPLSSSLPQSMTTRTTPSIPRTPPVDKPKLPRPLSPSSSANCAFPFLLLALHPLTLSFASSAASTYNNTLAGRAVVYQTEVWAWSEYLSGFVPFLLFLSCLLR
jgi:hypothetical protein